MRTRLILMLALALCACLRFYQLNGYGLWSDEFVTLLIVTSNSYKDVIQRCFEVPQPMPPLYFLVNKWIYSLFAPGEIGLRALSAGGSSLAGYFLFAVGRALFNAEIGLWSLLFFAVNSTQIVYAQNARPYALCLMLSTVSMLCFLKWKHQSSRLWAAGLVISTALLLHVHYIFFPLILIQSLCLIIDYVWPERAPRNGAQWKSWLTLQAGVAILLSPLYPQLWRVVHARHSLNWESKYPGAGDFFVFLEALPLVGGVAAWILFFVAGKRIRRRIRRTPVPHTNPDHRQTDRNGFILLGLWYLLPLGLFLGLAYGNGLNLFVERYLILASLPVFVVLPALALSVGPRWVGRGALLVYFLAYLYSVPAMYFAQKGQFSQGVPGGNEWREVLGQLTDAKFESALFLFQSPFIESNQLDFAGKPDLTRYLSAPLHSFYVQRPIEPFVLLPVHWWIMNTEHLKLKSELYSQLLVSRDFTLLATQEFFDYFEPWLEQAGSDDEWQVLESFRSTGALRLKRLRRSSQRD